MDNPQNCHRFITICVIDDDVWQDDPDPDMLAQHRPRRTTARMIRQAIIELFEERVVFRGDQYTGVYREVAYYLSIVGIRRSGEDDRAITPSTRPTGLSCARDARHG